MKKIKFGVLPLAMTIGVLAGCATSAQPTTEDTEAFASKVISEKLVVAVSNQHSYLAALKEDGTRQAVHKGTIEADQIDIDYIGKPQELIKVIANRYGYAYVESGKRSDLKQVNVWARKVTPLNVLKDIGVQVDHGADVILDKNTKTVRLVYKTPMAVKG